MLRQINTKQLALAVNGCQVRGPRSEVRDKVTLNASERAPAGLLEELQGDGPVRDNHGEEAQAAVIRTIHSLEMAGGIVICRGGSADEVNVWPQPGSR